MTVSNTCLQPLLSSGNCCQITYETEPFTEDAGKSAADSLGIALHLVDMLPAIPLQLAFNTATAGLLRCAPEVYAVRPKMRTDGLDFSHAPPLGSD